MNGTLSLTNTRKLYLSGDLGYSFAIEKAVKGSVLGELSVGWKFKLGKFTIAPEVGYRYDRYKVKALMIEEVNGEYVYREHEDYHFSYINSLSAGFSLFF